MNRTEAERARWALAAIFLANGMLIGAWAPQIPLLLPRHGIDKTVLGVLILGLGLGAMAAMVIAGKAIPRFGTLKLLRWSVFGLVPALPLVVYAPSLATLALAMVVFGLLMGVVDVVSNANAVEVERRVGRAVMSSLHGFWSLGGFFAGTSGAFIVAKTSGETQSLIAAVAIALIVAIALPFLRGEPAEVVATAEDRAVEKGFLPRERGIWILGVMALLSMVPEGAILDWANLYLSEEFAADEFTAGLGFAFFAASMALIRFLGDRLRNRFGAVNIFLASALMAGFGLALMAVAPLAAVAILGAVLAGFGCANLVPVIFSAAGNYPGQRVGAALSVVTMVGYAGILIAPAAIGFIAEHFGHRVTYGGLAVMILSLAALAKRTASADHRQVY